MASGGPSNAPSREISVSQIHYRSRVIRTSQIRLAGRALLLLILAVQVSSAQAFLPSKTISDPDSVNLQSALDTWWQVTCGTHRTVRERDVAGVASQFGFRAKSGKDALAIKIGARVLTAMNEAACNDADTGRIFQLRGPQQNYYILDRTGVRRDGYEIRNDARDRGLALELTRESPESTWWRFEGLSLRYRDIGVDSAGTRKPFVVLRIDPEGVSCGWSGPSRQKCVANIVDWRQAEQVIPLFFP